jgi:hypothetical protein
VGVAAQDKMGHNNSMANSRVNLDSKGMPDITAKVLAGKLGAVDGQGRAARSSVVRAR